MQHHRIRERRIEAMKPVALAWHEAEDSFNQTMVKLSQAMASIPQARLVPSTHFPLEAGMEASKQIAAAALGIARSYETMVKGHRCLGEDRERLAPRSEGDLWPSPNFDTEVEEVPPVATRPLRAVG